jgi:hypothetical protein
MSADNTVISLVRALNDELALEISNPKTSAETVPTTAVDTVTRFRVSLVVW